MILKLAWRNLWRNKRRTFITIAAIFLAVILSTMMMSLKEGVYEGMIKGAVGDYMGYVKVNGAGFWEEKNLDNSLVYSAELEEQIMQEKDVKGVFPRLETFALAASDSLTRGSLVVGVDPELEKVLNHLDERIDEGEYFTNDDKAILIGKGLADYLKVGVSDTLVLLGMGFHSASAAGKYPIKGIVKFGSPELSKQLVFLPAKEAQWLYNMENRFTSLILHFKDPSKSKAVSESLSTQLSNEYEVMHWEEHNADLKKMIETDRVEGYVFMFILYLVISFGIFSTVLMMLQERMHEFGVLIALGMKRLKLATMVLIEVIIMSLLGALVGMFGAFPVVYYFHINPIRFGNDMAKMYEEYGIEAVLKTSIDPSIFVQQAVVVGLIACVIAFFPFYKLNRMRALNAMNS